MKVDFYRSERDSMGVGWTRDISNSESCQVNKPYLFIKLKIEVQKENCKINLAFYNKLIIKTLSDLYFIKKMKV